jgi:hypothetical protein
MMAEGIHPFPYRTRKLSPPAPMVLGLKPWESRSLPGHQTPLHSEVGFLLCFALVSGFIMWHCQCQGAESFRNKFTLAWDEEAEGFSHMGEVSPEMF